VFCLGDENLDVCKFCAEELNTKELGVYRQVTGWSQIRASGGSNSLTLTSSPHAWAHARCLQDEKLRRSGNYVQTETLF
jgi:hypothetical protein